MEGSTSVVYSHDCEDNTIKKTVEQAVKEGRSLFNADLAGADLSGADLFGANLDYANLYMADLSDANLQGAHLYGANLHYSNLPAIDTLKLFYVCGDAISVSCTFDSKDPTKYDNTSFVFGTKGTPLEKGKWYFASPKGITTGNSGMGLDIDDMTEGGTI